MLLVKSFLFLMLTPGRKIFRIRPAPGLEVPRTLSSCVAPSRDGLPRRVTWLGSDLPMGGPLKHLARTSSRVAALCRNFSSIVSAFGESSDELGSRLGARDAPPRSDLTPVASPSDSPERLGNMAFTSARIAHGL